MFSSSDLDAESNFLHSGKVVISKALGVQEDQLTPPSDIVKQSRELQNARIKAL
jgi:hypothetical protein